MEKVLDSFCEQHKFGNIRVREELRSDLLNLFDRGLRSEKDLAKGLAHHVHVCGIMID